MTTLKDIREYMMNHLSDYDIPYDGEYYDEDGHCGGSLFVDIKEFWEDFKTNNDFEYLVSGEWFGEDLDLSGGRTYLLSDIKLVGMLFDYMYNTLGWSESKYQETIWNSCDLTDELQDRYDSISVKRDEKINSIIGNTQNPIVGKRNALENPHWLPSVKFDNHSENCDYDYIPHVIKYHKSKQEELDSCDTIEYLGKSKVDDNFVCYKIKSLGVKIPKGYDVVKPIEDILYGT